MAGFGHASRVDIHTHSSGVPLWDGTVGTTSRAPVKSEVKGFSTESGVAVVVFAAGVVAYATGACEVVFKAGRMQSEFAPRFEVTRLLDQSRT